MNNASDIDSLNPTPTALISAADKVAFYNTADSNTYSLTLSQLQDYVLAGGTIDPVFDDLTCATLNVTGTTTLRGAVSFLADATHDIGAVASARPRNVYTSADVFAAGVRVGRGAGAIATNVAVGPNALNANTTGNENIAIGAGAMQSNVTATGCTAVGNNALLTNSSATGSATAIGRIVRVKRRECLHCLGSCCVKCCDFWQRQHRDWSVGWRSRYNWWGKHHHWP
jgi:hypothetical protein